MGALGARAVGDADPGICPGLSWSTRWGLEHCAPHSSHAERLVQQRLFQRRQRHLLCS